MVFDLDTELHERHLKSHEYFMLVLAAYSADSSVVETEQRNYDADSENYAYEWQHDKRNRKGDPWIQS